MEYNMSNIKYLHYRVFIQDPLYCPLFVGLTVIGFFFLAVGVSHSYHYSGSTFIEVTSVAIFFFLAIAITFNDEIIVKDCGSMHYIKRNFIFFKQVHVVNNVSLFNDKKYSLIQIDTPKGVINTRMIYKKESALRCISMLFQ
jgi:hypothetical protein